MAATGNEAVRLSQLKALVDSMEPQETECKYSLNGSIIINADVAKGFRILFSSNVMAIIRTIETESSLAITYMSLGTNINSFNISAPDGSEIEYESAAEGTKDGAAITFTAMKATTVRVLYSSSQHIGTTTFTTYPKVWLAGTSSNSVSLLSASGNEAVTVDQAAEALGITPTGTPDIGGRAIRLSQLKTAVKAFPSVEIVPWSTGTDEQIAAMVAAADAGKIVLSDYWSAGDTRTVHLSAMAEDGTGDSHAAQDVQFVLTDPGHYTLANGQPCNFVVLQKDCLNETGKMNHTNTNRGGWEACARRKWCNGTYRNSIPATLRPIFKQFKTYAANGSGSTAVESTDYFALFSEKEVFGSTTYADKSAESQNTQLDYYKDSSNRIKLRNGSAWYWWERSPYSGSRFCRVYTSGSANNSNATSLYGLAPFGCI